METPRPNASPPASRSVLPTGLLGMLAIVALLEMGVFKRDRYTSDQAESWSVKARWASDGTARGADVLVFGDSLLEFAALPAVIAAETGENVRNLAAHNGGPALARVLLQRAIDSGARPEAVVLNVSPHQLARGAGHAEFARSWAAFLRPAEAFDLAVNARDPSFFASAVLSRFIPSYGARHEIRVAIAADIAGVPYSARPRAILLRKHWAANLGAQVADEAKQEHRDNFDGLFPETWTIDPGADREVRAFLELAREHGIRVVLAVPPISPGAQKWRDERDLDAPYDSYLRSLQEVDRDGLTIVDARRAGFGDGLFLDAVHLNREGAEAFSRSLGRLLAEPESAQEQIELALPEPVEGHAPGVQTLDQTKAALRRATSAE